MASIFEVQPPECRAPMPFKELDANCAGYYRDGRLICGDHLTATIAQAALFDPTEAYENVIHLINPFDRIQGRVGMQNAFPHRDGTCACGCGNPTKQFKSSGNYKKWSGWCNDKVSWVVSVMNGNSQSIRELLHCYYGNTCNKCNKEGEPDGRTENGLYADHIVPVKHGGGGSWLSNYQWLCHDCHVGKTCDDFNWKRKGSEPKVQLELNF